MESLDKKEKDKMSLENNLTEKNEKHEQMEIERPHQPHNHLKDAMAAFFNYKVRASICINETTTKFLVRFHERS